MSGSETRVSWFQKAIIVMLYLHKGYVWPEYDSKFCNDFQFWCVTTYCWTSVLCMFVPCIVFATKRRQACLTFVVWVMIYSSLSRQVTKLFNVSNQALAFSMLFSHLCLACRNEISKNNRSSPFPSLYTAVLYCGSWVTPIFVAFLCVDSSLIVSPQLLMSVFVSDVVSTCSDIVLTLVEGMGNAYEKSWI